MKSRTPSQERTPTTESRTPQILLLDDERHIHSAIKLRLDNMCHVTSAYSAQEALGLVAENQFDLCIVDIQMAGMDGLTFIEKARELDPALGYVICSANGTEEHLLRTIPLHVFEFLAKPLVDREQFEGMIPEWVARTRNKRNEIEEWGKHAETVRDLDLARIEREVESIASESAREALFQTAGSLTTADSLLMNACQLLDAAPRTDPRLSQGTKYLREARKHILEAATLTDQYFGSAYANRESSPVVIASCVKHAIAISCRLAHADERQQTVDQQNTYPELTVSSLSGMEFLVMIVPAITQALLRARPGSTIRLRCEKLDRLDACLQGRRDRSYVWLNRRRARISNPGVMISIRTNAEPPGEDEAVEWLQGGTSRNLLVPTRGLTASIQKSHGLAGVSTQSGGPSFELVLAVPL
jgi:CheY-like chemotaxis protein